jgi:hypothetical protein
LKQKQIVCTHQIGDSEFGLFPSSQLSAAVGCDIVIDELKGVPSKRVAAKILVKTIISFKKFAEKLCVS